ncbi:MAG: UDP-glucose 4-epimerase GalE [Acidimicrobiia bacterium]|nr:UDP-glucose 4-epimerase GalE [Acidimicrobiia bacterium]
MNLGGAGTVGGGQPTTVMLTGGTGFIGSHQAVALLTAGHDVVLVDDLSNSHAAVIDRIGAIAGRRPHLVVLDVRDWASVASTLVETGCTAVVHFAGRKHVAESMARPAEYFDVNLAALTGVVRGAHESGVRRLVFSSSGSVYGPAATFPIPESAPKRPTNPYSLTKLLCEQMLTMLCRTDPSWSVVALRYFNPAGAHPSGLLGESSTVVSNLLPVVMEVAGGRRTSIPIYGSELPTTDGTAVRDYVHVMDVVQLHQRALALLARRRGFLALNIGRGVGVSVRQIVAAAERVVGHPLPTEVLASRPGDVATLYGDNRAAASALGPHRYRDLDEIVADAWRFEQAQARTPQPATLGRSA